MGHISKKKKCELKHEEHGHLLFPFTIHENSMWKVIDQSLPVKQNIVTFEQSATYKSAALLAFFLK